MNSPQAATDRAPQARPQVVLHNSVSVDGATTGFLPHLGQHYGTADELNTDARLVWSATLLRGFDHQGSPRIVDPGDDHDRPRDDHADEPLWFVVDSHAHLFGRLHELRAFPGVQDVVILAATDTDPNYLAYLKRRQYRFYCVGNCDVALPQALAWVGEHFGVRRLVVDSGPVLSRLLFDQDLVDEVSVLIHPIAVGVTGRKLFEGSQWPHHLQFLESRVLQYGVIHMRYSVTGREPIVTELDPMDSLAQFEADRVADQRWNTTQ